MTIHPAIRPRQREMLLDDTGSERYGHHGGDGPHTVVGETDGMANDPLENGDCGEEHRVVGRRVAAGATEENNLGRAGLFEDIAGVNDLLQARHSGRYDHWTPACSHGPQQRIVSHLEGRDLVRRDPEIGEEGDSLWIERRREDVDPAFSGFFEQTGVPVPRGVCFLIKVVEGATTPW